MSTRVRLNSISDALEAASRCKQAADYVNMKCLIKIKSFA